MRHSFLSLLSFTAFGIKTAARAQASRLTSQRFFSTNRRRHMQKSEEVENQLGKLSLFDTVNLEPLPHPGGDSVEALFSKLNNSLSQDSKKGRVRKSTFQLWDAPDVKIDGWKFNEWDYGKMSLQLASNARGLFTYKGKKIVVRGYDKFFNTEEVPETRWRNIENNTQGPYYLSLKENGCILFLSGLEDGTLVVTSKHSTGPRQGDTDHSKNHSYIGQKWVEKHLEAKGISKAALAKELNRLDVTGVAELCDDDFEEHVLEYTGDKAGIYLHGINLNTPKFATYPCEDVARFAHKYGFKTTNFITKDNMTDLKAFLDECNETGSWNGRDVEGFVVRCKKVEENGTKSDFFFKYKFTEPYLMYRDWREVTKKYISSGSRSSIKINRHKQATNRYLDFVIPILNEDKKLREDYMANHGIIELRDRFLKHCGKRGIDLVSEYTAEEMADMAAPQGPLKVVLVPVAVLGSGKTTLGVALSHLTGWAQHQNDELFVSQKNKKAELVKRVCGSLQETDVVFFDRNNHKQVEREQAINDIRANYPSDNIRFVCLNFFPDSCSEEEMQKLTWNRVKNRGNNHSTVHLDQGQGKVYGIWKGFLNRFEPVNTEKNPDAMFDMVIDMKVLEGTRANLELVIDKLRGQYPELLKQEFTAEQLNEAMQVGLEYKAKQATDEVQPAPKKQQKQQKQKQPKLLYFNIGIDRNVVDLVDKFYAKNPNCDASFWHRLKQSGTINSAFHVTLAHVLGNKDAQSKAIFNQLESRFVTKDTTLKQDTNTPLAGVSNVRLKQLCHNDKIMALAVDIDEGLPCNNAQPHITVGHVKSAKPFMSNTMLAAKEGTVRHDWNVEPAVFEEQPVCAHA